MSKQVQVKVSGPLRRFRNGFQTWLIGQGYARGTIAVELRLMRCLSDEMVARRFRAVALDAEWARAFRAESRVAGVSAARCGSSKPLLEYLGLAGVLAPDCERDLESVSWVEALLTRYGQFLTTEGGLTVNTVERNITLMRPLLVGLRRDAVSGLTATKVSGFVVDYSRTRPRDVARMVTALRSLLRFLQVEGLVGPGLIEAVPSVARRTLVGLPKALTSEQVASMLDSCDRGTVIGRRDLAILTVLSRLGLRAGEVALLRLDDIDWHSGEFTVSGKAIGTTGCRFPRMSVN